MAAAKRSVSFPDDMMARIDRARGTMSLSLWVQEACIERLKAAESVGAVPPGPVVTTQPNAQASRVSPAMARQAKLNKAKGL